MPGTNIKAGLRRLRALGLVILLMVAAGSAHAQLSPGELSQPHAFLEGVDNCGKCHSPDRTNLSRQCLACHSGLNERIQAGQGLHARSSFKDCEMCHVEHQGREFELIYFDGGKAAFDHSQTGYVLRGGHARLECNQCHRKEHMVDPEALADKAVTIDRTFLGLDTNCLSCHLDQHRGQLDKNCSNCHGYDSWKQVVKFNHANARFALIGKHTGVACEKCHPAVADEMVSGSPNYRQYRPVAFNNCTDCHQDPHAGRLGADCAGCHSPAGWKLVQAETFEHDRTRYPLRGQHALVACQKCHTNSDGNKSLRFDRCMDCHSDFHKGAFADRQQGGACEECHTVDGFRPARFSLAAHETTKYPLKGAHRAIPCNLCHLVSEGKKTPYAFDLASSKCTDCHRDPHKGSVDKFVTSGGCESCHTVEAWKDTRFDHEKTGWPLKGKHITAACTECHKSQESATAQLNFAVAGTSCSSCHRSVHGDQFVSEGEAVPCERCHTSNRWFPERFDHNRDARFPLDGAHARVACKGCHPTQVAPDGGPGMVRYIPLDTACAACHGNAPVRKVDL